jgi:hypothetical protein
MMHPSSEIADNKIYFTGCSHSPSRNKTPTSKKGKENE